MIAFTKMHGLGNDFIVIDNTDASFSPDTNRIAALADRRTGIGFDQMLLVESPSVPDVEFDYRIYNADGGETEHCGNGARCFARFVHDRGLTTSTRIPVNTAAGRIELILLDDGRVSVNMGIPEFSEQSLPFDAVSESLADTPIARGDGTFDMVVEGHACHFGIASLGNPHITLFVDDADTADVAELGALLESHERFADRVNVGFLHILSRDRVRLRVFERGVGETRACGTGACAAVAIAQNIELLDSFVSVELPGGVLDINWRGGRSPIEMTGPCSTVFEGRMRM